MTPNPKNTLQHPFPPSPCFSDLNNVRARNVENLSGGELQRFACAMVCIQRADIFMFDEPSSYLDVRQRLRCAITIRNLVDERK